MGLFNQKLYLTMSHLEKVRYLLNFGVTAKTTLNNNIELVYVAYAGDVLIAPAGEHLCSDLAIAAGREWLKKIESKAAIAEAAANDA